MENQYDKSYTFLKGIRGIKNFSLQTFFFTLLPAGTLCANFQGEFRNNLTNSNHKLAVKSFFRNTHKNKIVNFS